MNSSQLTPETQQKSGPSVTARVTATMSPDMAAHLDAQAPGDSEPTADDLLRIAFVRNKTDPNIVRHEAFTWDRLSLLLGDPQVREHKDGPGWLASDVAYRNSDHAAPWCALVLDIEAETRTDPATQVKTAIGPEPPPFAEMLAEVDLMGWSAIGHTSHSHRDPAILPSDTDHHRYRLVFAVSRPVLPDEVKPLAAHVARLLGIGDCVDTSCFDPARFFWLPSCPASRRHLFEHGMVEGAPLDVDALLAAGRLAEAAMQRARTDAANRAKRGTTGQLASVIDAFNAAHDIGSILEHHGYRAKGRNRWLWPESSSGLPGVILLPDSNPPRIFSHHNGDPLADDRAHDAFDCWRIGNRLEMNDAVKEAARLLGIERSGTASGTASRAQATETANGQARTSAPRAALTDDQKRHARAKAARILTADVSPLVEYPIDALGALADPARAMVAGAQVREAMAGQVLLSVAALLAQPLANIRTIDSVKPLSLYCITIGESGDGKTTADTCAQTAIQARQRTDAKNHLEELRQLEREPKGRGAERGETPREPYRIARDGTVEGIRRSFVQGIPSQGVFSSEAAAMLAGYGMNQDNRAKTAATFNGLWDDGELSVSRGTVGRIQLYDRRLSIHWLLQPDAAYEVMNDPLLSGIGFWPRFLIAWPEPQGPRKASVWRADQSPEIGRFWATCTRLMDMRPTNGWDDCSDLPVLNLTDEAMRLACDYFERMEESAKGRIAPLRDIKPYAVRSTEQALRIAGVLSVFENPERNIVTAETMRNGIRLAAYALETWRGVFGDRDVATARQLALTLYRWLLEQPEGSATLTAMSRIGPKATRPRDRRDTALATLQHARLATESGITWTAEVPE